MRELHVVADEIARVVEESKGQGLLEIADP
jgi:hypothetical protein